MTKQEEIREGLKGELMKHLYLPLDASEGSRLERDRAVDEFLDFSLNYLRSQGVVIINAKTGYVEPLIKEVKS